MRNRQSRMLETVRRVERFLDEHATLIPASIATSRRSLDDVQQQLSGYADAQTAGVRNSRGETNKQRALAAVLRNDHMRPIADVARLKLRAVPEFLALTMPPADMTSNQLVTHANAMAEAAAVHEAVFTEVGLPDDFIATLKAATSELTASLTRRNAQLDRRTGATAGLAAEEKRASGIIRLMDAIVRPALGTDDALLREWKSAKRLQRKGGGVAAVDTPVTSANPPLTLATSATPAATATVSAAPAATSPTAVAPIATVPVAPATQVA